jgi:hypothetical protein
MMKAIFFRETSTGDTCVECACELILVFTDGQAEAELICDCGSSFALCA